MLVAGDVGGTKTDLGIYSKEGGPHAPLAEMQLPSGAYPSLTALVKDFLGRVNIKVDFGCFDVAGPVVEGHVKTTNLPWETDEDSLASDLGLRKVRLLNDLRAVAQAVPALRPQDLIVLNKGQPVAKGSIAIIAPGTGLGESFLTWIGSSYRANGSEGGHSDFAPTDARQIRLLQYLLQRWDHVGVERVCSGIGVPNLYEFLRDVENIGEPEAVTSAIAAAPDRTKAIIEAGNAMTSDRCRAAVDLLVAILAGEAGNLALKVFATGGVYIAGGVALHVLRWLQTPEFLQTFTRKGRFRELMERVPVSVITTRAALLGAATYGLEAESATLEGAKEASA